MDSGGHASAKTPEMSVLSSFSILTVCRMTSHVEEKLPASFAHSKVVFTEAIPISEATAFHLTASS